MCDRFNYGSADNAFTIKPSELAQLLYTPPGLSQSNGITSPQSFQAFSSTQRHSQVKVKNEAETPPPTHCYTLNDNRKRQNLNGIQDELCVKKSLTIENILDNTLHNHSSHMEPLNFPKLFQHQTNVYRPPQMHQFNQSLQFDPSLYYNNSNPNIINGYPPYGNRVMINNFPSLNHLPIPYDNKASHSNMDSFVSDNNKESEVNDINSLFSSAATTIFRPPDDPEVFAKVPGRALLLNSIKKFDVTIAEIHRRINPPERLNGSLLGGILRRAKNKDGGKKLREELDKVNIRLESGRRKSVTISAFTSFAEEEIIHVVKDFDNACKAHYPARQIARQLIFRKFSILNNFEKIRQNLTSSLETISLLVQILKEDASPLGRENHPIKTLNNEVQKALSNFSLITHGFGTKTIVISLEAIIRTLQLALDDLGPFTKIRDCSIF